jgi:5,10-methylenetetrahydromethanopterin reductase
VRFSIRLNNDVSVDEFVSLAVAAESAGFDQVWISHDLFWRSAPVLLAAASVATTRIHLGVGIANPYSAHPSELAMHAATLQELTGGRFLLGLGAGAEQFLGWAGIARPRPLAMTRDAVLACRALLGRRRPSDDPVLQGSDTTWEREAYLRWPGAPVPIYLGVMGPKMTALAGEIADGVLALSYPPERATASAQVVREAARAAGRDPATLDIPACFWVSIDDDLELARTELAKKLAYYGPSISAPLLREAGLSPDDFLPAARALELEGAAAAAALITDDMLQLGIAGDVDTVTARCRGLMAAGADHLSFGPPLGADPLAALTLLGSAVLPQLRSSLRQS